MIKKKKRKWKWFPAPDPSVCCEGIADWDMWGGGVWGTHVDIVDPCAPKQALHGHSPADLSTPSSSRCRFNDNFEVWLEDQTNLNSGIWNNEDAFGWFSRNNISRSKGNTTLMKKNLPLFSSLKNRKNGEKKTCNPPRPRTNWPETETSTWCAFLMSLGQRMLLSLDGCQSIVASLF